MMKYCKLCYHAINKKLKRALHTSFQRLNLDNIRNIGILAHIDAGKTTTTERMLYYAGRIHHMGEVHEGSTVTDYMEQERDRGITITSASVAIPWLSNRINIIDTPGHIDFTMQVEQSLNVIDGAVVILDGSAGVEAQTITVWRQADRYKIPRIVYVNKMDRADSSLSLCLDSLKTRFNIVAIPIQLPIKGNSKGIKGIIDLISSEYITWHGEEGENMQKNLITSDNSSMWNEVNSHRSKLIDRLADLDDQLTDVVLASNSLENVPAKFVYDALQRVTVSRKAVPVLCGSSYKNIGVQLLMDYIVKCLPSPNMRDDLKIYSYFKDTLSAKAFKVIHDKQKGAITFFRIYTGLFEKNQKLYNATKDLNEQAQRIFEALADELKEVSEMSAGNIVAATGLKRVMIGDLVTSSPSAIKRASKNLAEENNITVEEAAKLLCPPSNIPQPVFFCTIEAPSKSSQAALDNALEQLCREDPSLTITYDEGTSQTILGGMGELHIDIIKDRILTEYKIEADLGPLQIAYKECITSEARETIDFNIAVGTSKYYVNMILSVFPETSDDEPLLVIDKHPDYVSNTCNISIQRLNAIRKGIENSVFNGPKIGCPILNARFKLHWLKTAKYTPDSILSSAAAQLTKKLLGMVESRIVEPIISLEIVTDDHRMSAVLGDLSRRRSEIVEQTMRGNSRVVYALAPLAELLGYVKHLRTITSGHSTLAMELHTYKEVTGQDEREAIKNITGFYPM